MTNILSTKLAILLTVTLPVLVLIGFIKFYDPPLPPTEEVVSRIIESGKKADSVPDKSTETPENTMLQLAELSFEAGAVAMASAIYEDPAILNQSLDYQYEMARAWWIKNNAHPSPLTTPRPVSQKN